MDRRFVSILDRIGLLLLLIITLYLFLWNVGASSISPASDEVVYVRVAQTTLHEGNLFPLYHGGQIFLEKPPLKLWLSALALAVGGESDFTFRIVDGLLGVVAVVLTLFLARRIFGWSSACIVAAFLVFCAPEWVISHHSFRRAVLDGLLTVMGLVAAYSGYSWLESKGEGARLSLIVYALATSFAVLTKSVAGFFIPACMVFPVLARIRSRRAFVSFTWANLIPVLTFAAYIAMLYGVSGYAAIRTFLGIEILDRITQGFKGHNTNDPLFYIRYLFVRGGAVPAYLLAIGTVGALIAARKDFRFLFLLSFAFVPVCLYSLSTSRVPWYINPFVPMMAMVAVYGALYLVTLLPKRYFQIPATLAIVFATAPPMCRALIRHGEFVRQETGRMPIDLATDFLSDEHGPIIILENCLSGRTGPRAGRFNVEGIYREILKPRLVPVANRESLPSLAGSILLAPATAVGDLPPAISEIARIPPYPGRDEEVVILRY